MKTLRAKNLIMRRSITFWEIFKITVILILIYLVAMNDKTTQSNHLSEALRN